jgi:DNA-binding GntR family transcriptional regulator
MARQVDDMYAKCAGESASEEFWLETSVFHANFHHFIADCAGCPALTRAIDNSQVLTFKILFDSALRRKKRPPKWHESLITTILEGDPVAADAAAREHIGYGLEDILECVEALQMENRWRMRS